MAFVRGNAMYVGGSVFSDEVGAAVEDTRRGPIMLMRSSGVAALPLGRGCRGDMSRVCWFNVGLSCLIGVSVTGHGCDKPTMKMLTPASNGW